MAQQSTPPSIDPSRHAEVHLLRENFNVCVVRSQEVFLMLQRKLNLPENILTSVPAFKNGIPKGKMAVILIGTNGTFANPKAIGYDGNGKLNVALFHSGTTKRRIGIFAAASLNHALKVKVMESTPVKETPDLFPAGGRTYTKTPNPRSSIIRHRMRGSDKKPIS